MESVDNEKQVEIVSKNTAQLDEYFKTLSW